MSNARTDVATLRTGGSTVQPVPGRSRKSTPYGLWGRAILGVVLVALAVTGGPAEATHFRFGHITWERTTTPNEVVFHVQNSFRRGGYAGTASDGSLAVGDTFLETIGTTTLFFGDGLSTGTLVYKVDAINTVEDWVTAHAIDPATGAEWRHTYVVAGIYLARIDSCCRTFEEINNAGLGYEVSSLVDLTLANDSPASGVNPIVACPSGPCIFQVPAVDIDLDLLTFRLSTATEAGDAAFAHPGTGTGTPLSVSGAGTVTWDSTGFPIGLYSTSLTLDENRGGSDIGKVMLDFLINTDVFLGVAPEFDVPPTPENGENVDIPGSAPVEITLQCSDGDAGDNVTIGHLGLPDNMTLSPPNPAGNPAVGILRWTPVLTQVGVVSLTCVDSNGNSALPHSFTVVVDGLDIPGGAPGDDDLFCDGLTIDQLIDSGIYNVLDHRLLPPSIINGTSGRDLILAGGFGDKLLGEGGDDCLIAGVGDDFASGGAGHDQIYGWSGSDVLDGGDGDDELFGADHDDILLGGPGNDLLDGWDNEDILEGGPGMDTLSGGDDIDILDGGSGDDDITGGFEADIIDGGAGVDAIDAGPGSDICVSDPADSPPPTGCVTFIPANTAPVITVASGDQSVDEGSTLLVGVEATDPDPNDALTWSGQFLPPFVTVIDHGDGTATVDISPQAGDEGSYLGVVLRVEDDGSAFEFPQSDFEVIAITVTGGNRPPVITQPFGNQTLGEGDSLSLTLIADDPDGDNLDISVIGLPSFATFVDNGNGTADLDLAPQPGDAGEYPGIFFRVADDGVPVLEDTEIISVTVLGGNQAPTIVTPIGNQTLEEGQQVSLLITADDPNPGDVLSWSTIDLPPFASLKDNLDRTATLRMRPQAGDAGTYMGVVIAVTDDGVPPLDDSEIIIITVDPPGPIGCADIRAFQARCTAAGTLQTRVKMMDSSHSGKTVTVGIDGLPHVLTINGATAQTVIPNAGSGSHTVSLDDPAACLADRIVPCP